MSAPPPPPRRGRPSLGAWWIVAALLVGGIVVVMAVGRSLVGGVMMASAFGVGAVLRLVLPADRVGALAIRSRALDVVTLLAVAALVLAAFFTVDLRPR